MNNATGPGGIVPGNYNASQLTQDQRNWLFNYFGHSGQAPDGYGGENAPGEYGNYTPGESAAAIAQQNFQGQAQQGVQTLQTQQGNLAQQYAQLLQSVTGIYNPLEQQMTQTAGEAESARGLDPNSQLFQQQVQGALLPVYGSAASNEQAIGQGSINDMNTLAQAIASAQIGVAGTGASIGLDYATLLNNLQAASIQNQKPIAVNGLVYNPLTNSFSTPSTNSPISTSTNGAATGNPPSNAVGGNNTTTTTTPAPQTGVSFANSLAAIPTTGFAQSLSTLFGNTNTTPYTNNSGQLFNPASNPYPGLTPAQQQLLGL